METPATVTSIDRVHYDEILDTMHAGQTIEDMTMDAVAAYYKRNPPPEVK